MKAIAVEERVDVLLDHAARRDHHEDFAEAVMLAKGFLDQLLPRVGGVHVVEDDADVVLVLSEPVVHPVQKGPAVVGRQQLQQGARHDVHVPPTSRLLALGQEVGHGQAHAVEVYDDLEGADVVEAGALGDGGQEEGLGPGLGPLQQEVVAQEGLSRAQVPLHQHPPTASTTSLGDVFRCGALQPEQHNGKRRWSRNVNIL